MLKSMDMRVLTLLMNLMMKLKIVRKVKEN